MGTSARIVALAFIALASTAGCGNDSAAPPPAVTITTPPGVAQPPVAVQPVAGQPAVPVVVPSAAVVPGAAPAGLESNFGTLTLSTGFTPDPNTTRGTSGGQIQASTLNASCNGWVSARPDHIFVAATPFGSLRFMINGGAQDTTLVIQKPDGSYSCNDDAEGTNPIVAGNFSPGVHRIWVGSYQQGVNAPYTLGITELSSVTAASLGGGGGAIVTTGTDSTFGTTTLAPGFTPDPNVSQGTSGGSVQATALNPGCTGWVASRPDHMFVATANFPVLRVMVRSDSDTTLVIQKPDGTYYCNDDAEGTNPLVAGTFPAGTYRVWIGSYQQGQNATYKLGFSELPSVQPSSL